MTQGLSGWAEARGLARRRRHAGVVGAGWLLLTATAGAQTPTPVSAASNPFADEQNLPTPLKLPSAAPAPMTVETEAIPFDGGMVLVMLLNGPDFQWSIDPLLDWVVAPKGGGESLALVHRDKPAVRLSLRLYKAKELVPNFDGPTLEQYLAAIRLLGPKTFELFSPFPPQDPNPDHASFGGFDAVKLNYGFANGTTDSKGKPALMEYWDYLVNLHDEYVLLVQLSGPADLVEWAKPQIEFAFGRGRVMKGLGVAAP
jgi:hypothetical protein